MRDYAWSLTQQSYQDAYLEFNRLSNEEEDTLSAYITGFISDIYLNDIELAITHYQSFSDKYFDHVYADIVDNRLMEIQSNLEDIIVCASPSRNTVFDTSNLSAISVVTSTRSSPLKPLEPRTIPTTI